VSIRKIVGERSKGSGELPSFAKATAGKRVASEEEAAAEKPFLLRVGFVFAAMKNASTFAGEKNIRRNTDSGG
jgi:hypothetical protein